MLRMTSTNFAILLLLSIALFPSVLPAQQRPMPASTGTNNDAGSSMQHSHPQPPHERMSGMDQRMAAMTMAPNTFIGEIERHTTSGTSAEPNSTPAPMLMTMRGEWMLMFHADGFILDTQQSTARGGDKLFSTNWFMPMAEHPMGRGRLTLRSMFSLEPATVTGERYPLLFQQGETAYGLPIADGQHPHNFVMELAALYDLPFGERRLLSLYIAPEGDPALGPTAFPHRASASENPVGALGHHQEDSTHIASDVITAGFAQGIVRLEGSGFHGREPDEHRWNINQGKIDSWSARLTLQPRPNWSGQFSYGRIASPEALSPGEDQTRTTASIMYNRPFSHGNWASTAVWGRTRSIPDSSKENSYLFESTVRFWNANYAWTRVENAGRTNELLIGEHTLPAGFREEPLTHVQAYTFGYDRQFALWHHLSTAAGAQVTTYGVGRPLQPIYGTDPFGISVFIRFRPH